MTGDDLRFFSARDGDETFRVLRVDEDGQRLVVDIRDGTNLRDMSLRNRLKPNGLPNTSRAGVKTAEIAVAFVYRSVSTD